jgi:hypothetical protein
LPYTVLGLSFISTRPPESVFKAELIKAKRTYVRLYLADGRVETKIWNAAKFTTDSDLRNNLGSG